MNRARDVNEPARKGANTVDVPKSWRAILDHLAKLRDAKSDAPRHKRRHTNKPSPVIQSYARNEMRRRQHKG
jgi:hypothetical protein